VPGKAAERDQDTPALGRGRGRGRLGHGDQAAVVLPAAASRARIVPTDRPHGL